MQEELKRKCDQLIENYNRIRAGNRFEYESFLTAGAAMFLTKGVQVDAEHLGMCRKLLKQRKGIFSDFRGIAEFIVCCKMALADDPETYLEQLDRVYGDLKSFFSDQQTLLAAMVIVDLAEPAQQAAAAEKARSIYKEMRSAHPWLTSNEDMPFAALMAVTGKDGASLYEEAEKNYELLKENLRASSESRQMLSHILAIYPGHAERKCEKLCRIDSGLREAKHALSRDRYLSILGTLTDSALSEEALVQMICEADDYLKQFKPFHGLFGVGSDVRRMMAVQMVQAATSETTASGVPDSAAISSVVSTSIEVTIIMLILMCAIIASTSAATSSSH